MANTNEYLTITEAAEYLGVDRQTIRARILDGTLPTHSGPDRRVKYLRRSDLDKLKVGAQ